MVQAMGGWGLEPRCWVHAGQAERGGGGQEGARQAPQTHGNVSEGKGRRGHKAGWDKA